MYLEKRIKGKTTKYYLVHSYRDKNNKVIKIRRYLGSNLKKTELEKLKQRAKSIINEQIKNIKTDIFDFSLSPREIESINKYDNKLKIQHLNKEEWNQFTEDFVYNTNAIEGSTILKNEVHNILNKTKFLNSEEIETKGVANAIKFIKNTKQDISINLLKKIHKLCFNGSKQFAGKIRNVEVVIKNAKGKIIHQGTPVKELEKELNEFIKWYQKNKKKFKPLILTAIMHNQFEDIHPFQDGNGRVGRLLLNFILIKNKYPPINILLEDRTEYYKILQLYSKENKIKPTLTYLIKQYKKTLKQAATKITKK